MSGKIRKMCARDKNAVIEMMRIFYTSPAVFTNGSEEIFTSDVDACISDSPYIEGFVVEEGGEIIAYSMIAKSFSTEFGKPCVWIEDIYVKEEYRGRGIGTSILKYIESSYPDALLRLEVEAGNERALNVYKKCGYEVLPYMEMKK